MNSTRRDAQAPSYRECLLPSVARTPSVTQVTPAKKITFLKQGDPRFSGVRLAVHQRTFKSFGTLMDELSQRVPLSFGVRSVTTPRGLHSLSALEQLEDGGCYLCSDRKLPETSSGPGRPQGRSPSAQQSQDVEDQREAPETSSCQKNPKAPRRVKLVKNGDPRFQRTVVLSRRDTRSLSAFLSKASGLLHFPVKQLYTPGGVKVNSLKALLHCPSVLVCAGPEAFGPARGGAGSGTETRLGQTSRNRDGSWGPKAKQSVIHSRSGSGSRPRRFSLLSERSGLSEPLVSPHRTCMGPAPDRHPQDTPAQLGPLVAGDGVEKKVHLNEDGSLSVEMKVRFHLLGNDTLLWSRRVGRASGEGEGDPLCCVWEGHPGGSSEPGAQGLGTQKAGCKEGFERGRWQPGSRYEIWTNPLYTAQGEGTASRRRARLTQHSPTRSPWSQRVAGRRRSSKDSVSPVSSDRSPKGSEPNSCCCSRTPDDSVGLHPASGDASQSGSGREAGGTPWAAEGPGPEGAGPGSRDHCSLEPRAQGLASALSDSSASAGSHEFSERGEQHQGCPSRTRAKTSPWKTSHGGGPCSFTINPSPLRNEDPQAEGSEQGTGHPQARDGSGMRLPLSLGRFASGGTAEGCSPSPTCASAAGRKEQESRATATSSPSTSGLGPGAHRGGPRQHHSRRDTRCPRDSPVSRRMLGPPTTGRVCLADPAPHFSRSSSGVRNRASRGPEPPSSASLHSQDTRWVCSAPLTPGSNSGCASNVYPPWSPSAETEGNPSSASDSFSPPAFGLGEKGGGDGPKPSQLLAGQHAEGKPGAHPGGCSSQMGTSRVCRTPGGETRALQASQPQGCQGPLSGACVGCSRYCPAPPRARPSTKKHPSSSSCGDHSADWAPGGAEPGEDPLDMQRPRPPGAQSGGTGTAVRAAGRGSPSLGPQPGGMIQGQVTGGGESLQEQEDNGRVMTPGALPRTSPEAVVREWLSNIPEEPEPMKREVEDDSTDVSGDGLEGPTEDPVDQHPLEGLQEPTQASPPSLEGAASEKAEPEGAPPVTGDAGPQSGEGPPHSGAVEAPTEAGAGEGAAGDCGVGQCVLPHQVSASIQIMKALVGSKQGRPSSLPEVSGPVGRRLSHSAQALISCLARLHFFDADLGSPAGKVRFTDSPRYQELLSNLQALWPGRGLGRGELDSGVLEVGRCQALPGLRSHAVTEDLTPTSSSGVDVRSGSVGSGEGSGPCAVDCALVSERTELPLEIPCQRPDSRTSGTPEELGNQQPSDPRASSSSHARAGATRKDEAEGSSGEPTLGSNLDQAVQNMMQEEAVQPEKMKEGKEATELQGEGVSGFPEEESSAGQELGTGSRPGEGAREDERVREEAAGRHLASNALCPPGRRGKRTETLGSLTERDSNASGRQRGPSAEPGLEKLPSAAETDQKQTQAKLTQGTGEKGPSTAHRGRLDPDPLWVSRLLRKMEQAFLADLASALAELRARWSLLSSDLLDRMVAELQQDVSRRLQGSTDKELRKIQSRAGRRALGPPGAALRWETTLQTEQRGHRLRGLRQLAAFSEQTRAWGPPFLSLEDMPNLSGAPGTQLGGEANGGEFCPCETCLREKVIPVSPKDTVGRASAPIKEAFDLQQILQKKKRGCANGETAGMAPEKTGREPLQRDPSQTGTVQGADGGLELQLARGPGAEEGDKDEDEGRQTPGRGEDPGGGEGDAATHKKGGNARPCVGHHPETVQWEEQGGGDKEETEGSGAEVSVESKALGRVEQSLGGQNDTTEVQETAEEEQPESGRRNQGEKEGRPQAGLRQGQSGEASGHSSPDQGGGPTPPPAPGGDTPGQRSGPKPGLSSSRASSLGNCSQLSQKGSKDEPSSGVLWTFGDEPKGVPGSGRKVTDMYPASSISEQGTEEGLTGEPSAGQGSDSDAEKAVKSLSRPEVRFGKLALSRTDGFGQDDLDF